MSRYDLEEALSEFVRGIVDNHDHEDQFAESDHHHDDEAGTFESKVEDYLEDFSVGSGCRTKQAFERAVMTCVEHWFDNSLGTVQPVRTMLRAVLAEARRANRPTVPVVQALTRCFEELRGIPTIDVPAEQSSDNGLTYTRT